MVEIRIVTNLAMVSVGTLLSWMLQRFGRRLRQRAIVAPTRRRSRRGSMSFVTACWNWANSTLSTPPTWGQYKE